MLSIVPANLYGYGAMVAHILGNPEASITASDTTNPLVRIVLSLVVGAIFGYAAAQLARAIGPRRH